MTLSNAYLAAAITVQRRSVSLNMPTTTRTTLVMGASDNPARYSHLAIHRLRAQGHTVRAIGRKKVRVADVDVEKDMVPWTDIDTITLYLNPTHQEPYYDYFLSLKPRRIIFNPGTENPELEMLASEEGIDCMEACTLVMLSTGQYS